MKSLNDTIANISDTFLSEAKKSLSLIEDMAAMERYMAESYSGRIFIELIQNADDCQSTRINLKQIGNDLYFANNGKPFCSEDIVAISRSGSSLKKRGESIGYRGVGFKSTTALSDDIYIYSDGAIFSFSKTIAAKINLIGILDQTYPGVNTYFDSPAREDGSQKWVDFATTYWHVDCVRKMSLNAFTEHYQNWCKRKKYNFSKSKAEEIYGKAKELVPVLPKDDLTKLIIKQAIDQLNSASSTVEELRTLMDHTAAKLPEYPIVMAMKGVGPSLGPQLIAEIGDVSRFTHKGALTAFAGVDPGVNESGSYAQKSVPTSKRGSADLRKTLFQVMDVLIKTKPTDDAVYLFLDKKRAQGKPYYVYMTAGANKFLRIYYGRVKEYLASLPESN